MTHIRRRRTVKATRARAVQILDAKSRIYIGDKERRRDSPRRHIHNGTKPKNIPRMSRALGAWGLEVVYLPKTGSKYGAYHKAKGIILMYVDDKQTFYHELAHHVYREMYRSGGRWAEEIVVEMTAAVLMDLYEPEGSSDTNTRNYVYSYSPRRAVEDNLDRLRIRIVKVLARVIMMASGQRIYPLPAAFETSEGGPLGPGEDPE